MLEFQSKESNKTRAKSNSNKPSSLVRLEPNCSIHQKKIGISKSKVPFFYLTKPLQVTKPCTKKITRTNKTSNFSPSLLESSTTSEFKKSTHTIKSSGIVGRVSIASSNAKVQCHQFTNIHFTSYNHNSRQKNTHCKSNEVTKKITRPNNTSNLSIIKPSSTKKTIRPNNTSSLSYKPTIPLKKETASSEKKESASLEFMSLILFSMLLSLFLTMNSSDADSFFAEEVVSFF